jgi:hypothetical protein
MTTLTYNWFGAAGLAIALLVGMGLPPASIPADPAYTADVLALKAATSSRAAPDLGGPDSPPAQRAAWPPQPTPDCMGEIRWVEGQGPACPTREGWRVFFEDGTSTETHGPDGPAIELSAPELTLTMRTPVCVASPSTEYHNYAIYAVPSDKANRYASVLTQIRDSVKNANGKLREEAAEHGKTMDYRFRCVGAGNTTVTVANETLPTASTADSFSTISNDLKNKGYNSVYAKYWVYYDDGVGGYCGQGGINGDTQPGVNNANNVGPDYGIGYLCWSWTTMMHESGHNLGAVQNNAPNNTGGWHCNDEYDVMCYKDGGPRNQTLVYPCPSPQNHFDCQHNSYFHAGSPTGYLATNWNLGHSNNRFVLKQDDCATSNDAGATHAAATLITLPKTNCSAALADGDPDDYYKFSITSGDVIKVTLVPNSAADFDLCLYNPTSTTSMQCSTLGLGSTDSITYTATSTGDWRARAYIYSGNGLYTLSVCKNC